MLILDANLPKDMLRDLGASVRGVLNDLPPSTSLALIVYSAVVTVYRVGVGGVASGDVFRDLADFLSTPEHQRQSYHSSGLGWS